MGVEIVAPLLQSTQTCVQLLLPRVSALAKQAATEPASEAAASLADAICEWRNLPWRTQLYVWPLVDRTVRSGCLLYTSDAADDTPCVDLGGR
eukprot:6212143-Pleurochrysis_carterae.AAC.3